MSAHPDASPSERPTDTGAIDAQSSAPCARPSSSLAIPMTVPEAIATLTAEPRFRRLVDSFCGPRAESILHSADLALTEHEFQATLGKLLLEEILQKTSTRVETRVEDNLGEQPACLYISNHRDIVLDTALLNHVLISHGKQIPHVAIGDNLIQTQWLVAFYRLCRAFVIRRELSGKQLYEQSRNVSKFVHDSIRRGESVWLAQRPGRTKDGADKTEPSLLRMLLLDYERAPLEASENLNVTPVAVSYEIEPCDAFKAASLIGARTKNGSESRARGDVAHVMRGLVQPKGRICITLRPPIIVDNTEGKARGANRGDLIIELARKVDLEIAAGYAIWPTNYVAHDLLFARTQYADRYTIEQRDEFEAYLSLRAAEILAEPDEAKNALLSLYARPLATESLQTESSA